MSMNTMLIKIIEINKEFIPSKTGRGGYTKAQVVFETDTGKKTHNLMDFLNKQVYNLVTNAQPGATFEITTRKNDKGYDEWAAAAPSSASSNLSAANTAPKASVSNYETKEERAIRQRLIVRQSSLSAAIATLAPGSKSALNPDEVEALAERYNSFVFAEPKLFDQPNDLETGSDGLY